jgi:PAS domain S-box-containing protein
MNVIMFERRPNGVAKDTPSAGQGLFRALQSTLTGSALVAVDHRGRVTQWSDGARRMLGWHEQEAQGANLSRLLAGELAHDGLADDVPGIAEVDKPTVTEGWCNRKDHEIFWARTTVAPLPDPAGRAGGHLVLVQDRTVQHTDEERNRRDSQLLRSLLSASRDAVDVLQLDGFPDKTYADLWPRVGCALFAGCIEPHPDGALAFASARQGQAGQFHATTDVNGSTTQWEVSVTPILGQDGMPVALLAVSRDITRADRDAAKGSLVALEMGHRLKNVLAIVQAIASQTLRGPTMPADLRKAFDTRLLAFFRAQDLLTRSPAESVELHHLVESVATLHCRRPSTRFRADGPAVTVGRRTGLALSMVLHELGANAIKYGALSAQTGIVHLAWNLLPGPAGTMFRLTWTESGGPPVAPARHKGFGTRLIELSFSPELGLTWTLDYAETGVVFTLEGLVSAGLQT